MGAHARLDASHRVDRLRVDGQAIAVVVVRQVVGHGEVYHQVVIDHAAQELQLAIVLSGRRSVDHAVLSGLLLACDHHVDAVDGLERGVPEGDLGIFLSENRFEGCEKAFTFAPGLWFGWLRKGEQAD